MKRLRRGLLSIALGAVMMGGGCCHFLGIGCNDCKPTADVAPHCDSAPRCGTHQHAAKCRAHAAHDASADVAPEQLSIDAPAPELIPLPTRPVFGARMSGLQAGMHEMLQPGNVDQFVPSTAEALEKRPKSREPATPRSKLVTTARFIEPAAPPAR